MTLVIRNLSIGYCHRRHGARVVARNLDLALRPGTFTCLLGPNGAGKSTLIRTLTGLQPALEGEVLLDEKPLRTFRPRQLAQRLSLVLTQRVPVGTLPVWSLVAMGRHPHTAWTGRLQKVDEAAVHEAIEAVGMTTLAWRPMCELSDGERQKAMIARALAQEPRLMILDEATAHLDLPRRVELMELLRRLAVERDCAILLSSHDLDLSLRSADRLWLMSRDGQVREGVPEDLVLGGAFEAAFEGGRLVFDPWSGAFQWPRRHRGSICVEGRGLSAVWTRRALERAGFEVVKGEAPLRVVLLEAGTGSPLWRVDVLEGATQARSTRRCESTPVAGVRGGSPDRAKAGFAGPERTESTFATLHSIEALLKALPAFSPQEMARAS
jgi:iron complex transport system ATP-binding protein